MMIRKIGTAFYKTGIMLILALNIVLLARVLGYIYLPGELTPLEKAKQGAQAAINYSEGLASSYGVNSNKSVIDIMARFKYEIERANNAEDVASLMLDYGRQTQDIIFREVQNKRINTIFTIINNQQLPAEGKITISRIDDNIRFLDPKAILTDETKEQIKEVFFNHTLEIEIANSRAQLAATGDIFNQVDFLQTKVASLERQLKVMGQRTGYEPLIGPGITIRVYDHEGLDNSGIVHDYDIRNIINELNIAGARGIEVGAQRLTVNSAVRCVGPTILVNNKPIPVNPIVIKAVGNSQVLSSSLGIVSNQLNKFGIKLEIEMKEEVILSGLENYEG